MDFSEKRDFPRVDVECQVSFHIEGANDTYSGELLNLSAKGLLFITPEKIAVDSELDVHIVPSNPITPPMHASVKVVRSDLLEDSRYKLACEMLKIV